MINLLDQRDLIEKDDWNNLIILDALRYDSFEQEYPKYITGKLTKVWNGSVSFTYDWFERTFRRTYDAVLFTAVPLVFREKYPERGWMYPTFFKNVVGHLDIEYSLEDDRLNCKLINKAVLKYDWKGRRVIRYLAPHPPFPNMKFTEGKGKVNRVKQRLSDGRLTLADLQKAYIEKLHWGLEAIVELYPFLDKPIIITSDHGECLGDCGQIFHGRNYKKHRHLIIVPWFEVESLVERR